MTRSSNPRMPLTLAAATALMLGLGGHATAQQPVVHHKTVKVGELDIFYREAGPKDAPAIHIRAGKFLPVTCTEVVVRLRRPPVTFSTCCAPPNHVRFRISPEVEIALGMTVMDTEERMTGQPVELLASRHPGAGGMDAYERLLGDAMDGDATLFAREDYVEEAWRIVDPVLQDGTVPHEYQPGTWGPRAAEGKVAPAGGWLASSSTGCPGPEAIP